MIQGAVALAPQLFINANSHLIHINMLTKYQPYQNLALAKHIESQLKSLDTASQISAKTFGGQNKPLPEGDTFSTYIESIRYSHQALLDLVNKELQAEATRFQVVLSNQLTNSNLDELREQLRQKLNRQQGMSVQLNHTPVPRKLKNLKIAYLFIFVLSLAEGVFTINGFTAMGIPAMGAIVLGITVALCLAAFAHTVPKLIAEGKNTWQKRAIGAALFLLICSFFYVLSAARASHLFRVTGVHYDVFPFLLSSLFLLVVAIAVAHYYLPDPEERETIETYKQQCADEKKAKQEVEDLRGRINTQTAQNQHTQTTSAGMIEFQRTLENQIINHAYKNAADFKTINITSRTDNRTPDCFTQPVTFQFTRYAQFTQPEEEQ